MKNIQKLIVSKPMKYNKSADTRHPSVPTVIYYGSTWKNIEKTLFVSAGAQKRWKTAGSGITLPWYLPIPKSKFPVKFIFT